MGKDSHALVTGLFMVTLIVSIVIIVIWLGDVERQTQTYVATTRGSVTGLKAGSTVYYRGIDVGKVSAVRFDTNDPSMIVVPMEVDRHGAIKPRRLCDIGVSGRDRIDANSPQR